MKSKFMSLEAAEIIEMIDYAKKTGVSVDERDENGDTYLHYCVKKGLREEVMTLCKSGADIYAKNSQGLRPVDIAWENKEGYDMLGLIIEHSPLAASREALRASA